MRNIHKKIQTISNLAIIIVALLKKFSSVKIILCLLSVLTASSINSNAQDDIIRVDTNLVTIPATVLDRDGRYVTNLKKEDFQIFEDDVEQEITFFEPVEQSFTIFILLDVSGSMTYEIENLANAANNFLGQLRPDDCLTAATFDDWVDVLFKVSSVKEIRNGKKFRLRVAASRGDTQIYDVVDYALKKMKKIRGRKAIVLFSDGKGTGYTASAKSNLRDAEEQEALIYTIQFDTFVVLPGQVIKKEDAKRIKERVETANWYMHELAEKTGGRNYRIAKITDLAQTFGTIANELGRQYRLGYYPKQLEKGQIRQMRQIKVKVRQPNLVVRARNNYFVEPSNTKQK